MYIVERSKLDKYLLNDPIADLLNSESIDEDESLVCHGWLRRTPAKRYIFGQLYGDILNSAQSQVVLDVGGGLTGLTRVMARRHQYQLVDLLAHDGKSRADEISDEIGRQFVQAQDWMTFQPGAYDLVIANDLFPNVDQRLEMFLEKFLPAAKRIRMSLTFYDKPRYYMTRRVDADEILCVLAWNGENLVNALRRFSHRIISPDFSIFSSTGESVFDNGRHVCLVELRGDLDPGRG